MWVREWGEASERVWVRARMKGWVADSASERFESLQWVRGQHVWGQARLQRALDTYAIADARPSTAMF